MQSLRGGPSLSPSPYMIPMNDTRSLLTRTDWNSPPTTLTHSSRGINRFLDSINCHTFNGFSEPQRHLTVNAVSCCMFYWVVCWNNQSFHLWLSWFNYNDHGFLVLSVVKPGLIFIRDSGNQNLFAGCFSSFR